MRLKCGGGCTFDITIGIFAPLPLLKLLKFIFNWNRICKYCNHILLLSSIFVQKPDLWKVALGVLVPNFLFELIDVATRSCKWVAESHGYGLINFSEKYEACKSYVVFTGYLHFGVCGLL